MQVEFLPPEFWASGLGHLGNASLWSLATLPYLEAGQAQIFLYDFDRVEPENVETGLIFSVKDAASYKTRSANSAMQPNSELPSGFPAS